MTFVTGHKMPRAVREKISKTMTGRKRKPPSKEVRLKMSLAKQGDRNYRWKGGSPEYHRKIARKVWEEYWNELKPNGYLVHHVDMNYKNNHITNLALVTMSHHLKCHRWRNK